MLKHIDSLISPLGKARSFLFVPGHQPKRFQKALDSGADAVVIDLEDAVPIQAKEDARKILQGHWSSFSENERSRLLVRVNPSSTPWHRHDLDMLGTLQGLGAAMLPKAESEQQILELRLACHEVRVLPLIETAEGIKGVDEIARSPGVVRLGLGHIDLQADLGMLTGPDQTELIPARWAIVLASRLARLNSPVDSVTTSTTEESVWLDDATASRRLGFGAKLCIHPIQVAGIHKGFAPSPSEVVWAKKVLKAEQASGGGAFSVDGKMIDPPVIQIARQVMDRHAIA